MRTYLYNYFTNNWLFRSKVALSIFFLISCLALNAANADSLMLAGNNAYGNNSYEQAIEAYDKVIEMGYVSTSVYLNLGNAHYKLGDYPRAILNYERALLLEPSNEKANFNLSKAKTYIIDQVEIIPEFFMARGVKNFVNTLNSNAWALISLSIFIASWILFLLFFLSRKIAVKRLSFVIGIIFLVISTTSFFFSHKAKKYIVESSSAIVLSPTVTVKGAPSDEGVNVFIIHEGTKVFISDEVADWYEIKLSDGKQGWLLKTTIEKI